MPKYSNSEGFFAEFCMLFWVLALIVGAKVAPYPTNILLWIWAVGIFACIPVAAWLGTQRDNKTTMCREMTYFLRRGCVGMKVFFWPVTLLIARFTDSERSGYLSDTWSQLQAKHYTARPETITEMTEHCALKIDRNCDTVQSVANHTLDVATEMPALACRTTVVAATLTGAVHAQNPAPTTSTPTTSVVLARTGVNLKQPHTGTYRLIEFLQVRGKWVYPDVGCVDFATGKYRECFIGGGRTLYNGKKLTVTGELYFVQATGPTARSARYLWPNAVVDLRLTPKLTAQTSYVLYVPLNQSARVQQVLERVKVERTLGRWKVGAGYGAYQYGTGLWQSKPFVTTTVSTKAGSFEIWIQKMPVGSQLQVRYSFVHTNTH